MGHPKKGTEVSRAERKARKRKLEDAIPDVPGDNDVGERQVLSGGPEKSTKKRKRATDAAETDHADDFAKKTSRDRTKEEHTQKGEEGTLTVEEEGETKERKDKKRKKEAESEEPHNESAGQARDAELVAEEEAEAPRKSKKERKAERKAREVAKTTNPSISETAPDATEDVEAEEERKAKKNNRNRDKKRKAAAAPAGGNSTDAKPEGKASRFIVFVGNLPFSATTESIQKHFASVKPKSVRHLTQKDEPTKSKGAAFVEFHGYDSMKTCLKLFHHSTFDDGVSPPRKINVELSAGGGGNSKDRRSKIDSKNRKLNKERSQRIQEEQKAKSAKSGASIDESIHPSRRGLVPV
ncbi:hypothetical protein B7494_g3509 [Chlorociboria aeruginascens]|nr:hypothetical protein B7494_g3509 [Chlorociboria aeruginascens]